MHPAPRPMFALLGTSVLLALGGCSVLEPDKIDYKSSGRGVSLEIPPDLTQLPDQSRYSVTGGAISASEYQAGQQAAAGAASPTASNTIADVHFMRDGGQRWLSVERPAEQVWGQVRDFWLENGFLMAVDQANMGLMETDWAENRAKIPQDVIRRTIGKVFDSLYSTGERDKFRTRIERNVSGGTDIFITHRGMEEVYATSRRDETIWQPRARDPELEAEFLRRLMVTLGTTEEQARAALQQAETASASGLTSQAQLTHSAGQPALQLSEPFDRAWRRTGLALDRTGFTVEDRDRSQGIYFVRYLDPSVKKEDPGFFKRMFGGGSAPLPTRQYQIRINSLDAGSLVSVHNDQGQAAEPGDAQRILQVLLEELN